MVDSQFYDALIPTLIVLFGIVVAAYYLTGRRIVSTLKANYPSLWVSLGSPEPIDSLMFFRGGVFADRPASGRSLNDWLSAKEYANLNDATLCLFAPRLRLLRVLGDLLIPLIVGSYTVHR